METHYPYLHLPTESEFRRLDYNTKLQFMDSLVREVISFGPRGIQSKKIKRDQRRGQLVYRWYLSQIVPKIFGDQDIANIIRTCGKVNQHPIAFCITQLDHRVSNSEATSISKDLPDDISCLTGNLKKIQHLGGKISSFLYKKERVPVLLGILENELYRHRNDEVDKVTRGLYRWIQMDFV